MTHLYLGANARRFVFVFAAFAAITTSLLFDSQRSEAQKFTKEITPELVGTITGRVFQDYNSNGTYNTAAGLNSIDTGVAGVTITAYDAAGVAQGFTASAANGTYSLNATGTGPYRLEFTTIPAGYSPSARSTDSVQGGAATNAGSTEQFVSNGNTADVNLALTRAEEYCQDNPTLIVSRFAQGAQNGIYAANAVLYDFPYNSGTTYTDTTVANYDGPTAHTLTTQASAIGTIYSLAYNRSANRIYAASFFKKHSGFGPGADGILNNADDPSAIYLIDPATSAVTSTISVPGVTTNSHDVTDYADDNGNTGWDAAAKTGIGGIDLSDDNSVLYVMNMQDRRLYALNSTTGAQIGATTATAITTGVTMATPNGTNGGSCIANNRRPFAVKYYRGSVYIGVVCTGETGDDDDDLRGYIFQVNPGTMAITAAPVFVFDLDYARGEADPGEDAEWQQWRTTISSSFAYPQALLSDIEFEGGNLIIGLRDRVGDQSLDAGPDGKRTAGDTLRACGIFGSWTLESNGRCGTPVTGSAPQTTGEGPGGGEFYHNDDFCLTPNGGNYHDEVSWGSLLYLPGRQHVVTTLLDPISRPVSNGATFDGGFRYWNNSTGNAERAYRIYNGLGGVGQPDFGKSNGLGSLTAMCTPAPIEIGNRIWNDNDNDGAQDAGETPLAGVTVRLYQGSTLAGTAITDANGEYYFVSSTVADPNTSDNLGRVNGGILRNTAYQVRLDDPANFLSGGPLSGRSLTVPNQSAQAGDDDSSDSDATLAV
ncbi:MAG TPA: SdrD B-like domain-containing protein, partial [Pyrinomonadaceae bacterium]|nr:SdrD B-like domain-containing protein [Pyrinomonadaceae bacterium]